MGIDGAEIKRLRENKERKRSVSTIFSPEIQSSEEHEISTSTTTSQSTNKKKAFADLLRILVFAVVVPLLLVAMVIRYIDDHEESPAVSTNNAHKSSSSSVSSAPPSLSSVGYAEAAATVINIQLGNICQAEVSGIFSKTLKIDWTANTTKLTAAMVLGEVGRMKEKLYEDGVRYFQFPNDGGTYNVIDWKTGEKESISDRAPYSFRP